MANRRENFFEDNKDLQFQFEKRYDFDTLFELLPDDEKKELGLSSVEDYKSLWRETLKTFGEVAGSTVAPNAVKVEKEDIRLENGEVILPPAMTENLRVLKELGIPGLSVEMKYGGLGAPFAIEMAADEIVCRACPSTFLNAVWYSPIAHIINEFGADSERDAYIPKIASGEWSGSMALTEPDAGSDLSSMRSYGEKQADGSWKLYGSKRFISNGCGDLTLALAMNGKGAKGLKALNLYLVPRKIDGANNYEVTKIEEKPGLHGSATCELKFDGSKSILLGKDGEGFRYMLLLMNDARLGVAFQGLGMLEAIYRLANDYASQRKTWGKTLTQHERPAEILLDMEVDLYALRSLCFQAASARGIAFAGEKYLARHPELTGDKKAALEKQTAKMTKRLRTWTPLLKWWVGEKVYHHARMGLQLHGGYGFTKEYRAEWWVRESLILAIYEGTSQIQALMCMKDTLKEVVRRPREFVEAALGTRFQALAEKDPLWKKFSRCKQIVNSAIVSVLFRLLKENMRTSLSEAKSADILKMVKILSRDLVKFENLRPALLHAERICEMKAIIHMARAVLEDAEVEPSRRWIAERFINKSLPTLIRIQEEITMDDPVLLERLENADMAL